MAYRTAYEHEAAATALSAPHSDTVAKLAEKGNRYVWAGHAACEIIERSVMHGLQ
jgi:hypothetical protein